MTSAEQMHTAARLHDYGCILLDLGLPAQDGMQALAQLRASRYGGAILIVTARDKIPGRIAGLDGGADDFLVKPFDPDELAARIRSASRRAAGRVHETLAHGDIVLDIAERSVTRGGRPVALATREFRILLMLVENRGRVLSRDQLEKKLYRWDDEVEPADQT